MARSRKTKFRVFLVDEHPVNRYGLRHLINRETDLEVCGESDCRLAALTDVAMAKPHAVVVGVALKKSRGLSLIKHLHALDPNLSILVLSVQEDPLYAQRCLRAGAKAHLTLGEGTKAALLALRRVISGEVMETPSNVGKKDAD
jgi:DNA-binding NarL/FixJ family response regulator